MGKSYPNDQIDEILFWMEDKGRLGRKANAGFFTYNENGKRDGFWTGLEKKYPLSITPNLTDVQQTYVYPALEAVRALEDGVLMDIREGDVGAVLGWGFAPWSGGVKLARYPRTPYAAERSQELRKLMDQGLTATSSS